MNVIIPMAGHSKRFQAAGYLGPKAFLQIGDKLMIDHVVEMFAPEDRYFFVVNREQAKNAEHMAHLKSLVKKCTIVEIDSHEHGPTYSALQVKGLKDDEELIVAYCDFTVKWNYERFLRMARDYDAAAPSFKGFHPASFGHTFYAYMRVDENEFLELREKKSFTDTRHEEHASTGIYYFKRASVFQKYAGEVLNGDKMGLAEAYTSLLLNPMKRDGMNIGVFPVDKFICLGTPEDVEQYQFWYETFSARNKSSVPLLPQTNLIPMAGSGSRFQREGYRVAKPLIQISNRPMIAVACSSFPQADSWIFLARAEDLERHPIAKALKAVAGSAQLIPVAKTTSGQAATCLLAENQLDPKKALFIASCDYRTDYDLEAWQGVVNDPSIDAAIWTFRLRGQLFKNAAAFAYCRTSGTQVTEVVEKRTISETPHKDPMVVGSFWFRRAEDFTSCAHQMIDKGIQVNGEHYVGTSMNQMIAAGKKVVIFDVERWVSFGDPFELKVFEYWQEYFEADAE